MAEKSLGFVELEWVCPNCTTRNPGPVKTCAQCGAAQPEGVEFTQAAEEKLIDDSAKLEDAKAGADVHCGFCGTRNSARRTHCSQCGADLAEGRKRASGKVLGAHRDAPAPDLICPACGAPNLATSTKCDQCGEPLRIPEAPAPKPTAAPKRGCGVLPIVIMAVLAVIAVIIFMSLRTTELVGEVAGARWQRSIVVEGLVPVTRTAWREEVPDGAEILACEDEVRRIQAEPAPGTVEVCGTPFTVDKGSGFGEIVQECQYQILEERCDYRALAWQAIQTLSLTGDDLSPRWPALSLASQQRAGAQSQQLVITFDTDGDVLHYNVSSEEEFASFQLGSRWLLAVNSFGTITSVSPR